MCSGDAGHNHIDIYYVAQDALTSHVTDAAIFPNDLSGPLQFTPELQREDGSYIGSDNGENYVMAMGASGGILWQYQTGSYNTQNVPARPLYATADGGVIFTTSAKDCAPGDITTTDLSGLDCIPQDGALPGDSNFGQLGTLYTLDQNGNPAVNANGNPVPATPDTGAAYSWSGSWYAPASASVANLNILPVEFPTSYEASVGGNLSSTSASIGVAESVESEPIFALKSWGAKCVLGNNPGKVPLTGDALQQYNDSKRALEEGGYLTSSKCGSFFAGDPAHRRG